MKITKPLALILGIAAFIQFRPLPAAAQFNNSGTYCSRYVIYGTQNSSNGCPDPQAASCSETVFGPSGNNPNYAAVTVANKYNSEYESYLDDGFFTSAGDVLNYISDKFSGSPNPRIPDLIQQQRLWAKQAACPRRIGPDRKILPAPAQIRAAQNQSSSASVPLASASAPSSIAGKIIDAVNAFGAIILSYVQGDIDSFAKFASANAGHFQKYGASLPPSIVAALNTHYSNVLEARDTKVLRSRMRLASLLASLNLFDGAAVAADFDNNGVKDYAFLNSSGNAVLDIVMIRKVNGRNLPVQTAQYEFQFMPRVTPAQLSGDTLIDLKVEDPKGEWPTLTMINNGDGTFTILRPEGWPRVSMRALSSTACFTRVSSASTFCAEIGLNAHGSGGAAFGYVRQIQDPLYSAQFVGNSWAKNDEFKVRIQGRYQEGVPTDRMSVQAYYQDVSGQTYTESCSQSQSNYALTCSYKTTDKGVHWAGRCACQAF